jgi:hypothetical protein
MKPCHETMKPTVNFQMTTPMRLRAVLYLNTYILLYDRACYECGAAWWLRSQAHAARHLCSAHAVLPCTHTTRPCAFLHVQAPKMRTGARLSSIGNYQSWHWTAIAACAGTAMWCTNAAGTASGSTGSSTGPCARPWKQQQQQGGSSSSNNLRACIQGLRQ